MQKLYLLFLPLFLAACISSQPYPKGVNVSQPDPTPKIRGMMVGQQWVYNVRNVFNQELVDVVTETVVSVGEQVRIKRSGIKAGSLPDEIQSPQGFILQDPHWSPPQIFQSAIPLWPEELQINWSGFYRSQYKILGYPDGSYYWGLSISALQWELLDTPAGQFMALKYSNEAPYFQSNDVFRLASYRQEDIWLAPDIGRWVIRRGYGRYITSGVSWVSAYWEDYLQWELISWK